MLATSYNLVAQFVGISEYLYAKAKNVWPKSPQFEQLLQPDVVKKLEQMQIVKRFKLKVRDSLFSSHQEADEYLAKTFEAAKKLGDPREIELILSTGRAGGSLGKRIQDIAKSLFLQRETTKDVISGEIKGTDELGRPEIIDLLKAKLVAEKRIPKNSTSNSATRSELFFSAINQAYEELKDQLIAAVGVTLCPD